MHILSEAPSRISLFGGSSDLPDYYYDHGGVVISLAINLRTQIHFYQGEDSWDNPGTKFPHGANPDLYYSILTRMGVGGRHAATSRSSFDGVIGAGLGSSASFSVALIAAIKKAKGEKIDRRVVAELAWDAEQKIGRTGGKQDQYAAAYGGANVIIFPPHGEKIDIIGYEREPIEDLIGSLVLFYIGGTRESSSLQQKLRKPTKEQIAGIDSIKDIAMVAHKAMLRGNITALGELLHESWLAKRQLNSKISSSKIDDIYAYGRQQGALGGKICGAGGCGYMLFIVPKEKRAAFVDKMRIKHLEETDFSVNWDGVQTRII
jgi:D-glycero-alpha-D-manno-heptose-7-phosphate kinase